MLFPFRERIRYFSTFNDVFSVSFPIVGLTLESQIQLLDIAEEEFEFAIDADYAGVASARGLDDLSDGLYLPLRPLSKAYWEAANNYSSKIVDTLYATDNVVVSDKQLQSWLTVLQAGDKSNVNRLTDSACGICDRASLKELLGRLMFSSLAHSSTFIISRASELMYYPFAATSIRSKHVPANANSFTEQEFLNMFSDANGILESLYYFHKGSTMVQTSLRDWPSEIDDSVLRDITEEFVDNVYSIAEHFEQQLDIPIVSRIEGTVLA